MGLYSSDLRRKWPGFLVPDPAMMRLPRYLPPACGSWPRRSVIVMILLSVPLGIAAAQTLTQAEIELYRDARSIVEFSQEELIKAYPELKHVTFDFDQEQLDPLLDDVGKRIESMFHDLPNTASREEVRQDYSGFSGIERRVVRNTYDYLFLTPTRLETNAWVEVRSDSKGRPIPYEQRRAEFLTSGFAGLGYFFHPRQQPGSVFRHLGRSTLKTREHVLAFAQKADSADCLGSFKMFGVPRGLLFQGLAWIDPKNNQILRMRTELLAPRSDFGLYRLGTEIWFVEVRFKEPARRLWLPREVIVTIEYRNRSFRNRHNYSDYRLFTVESYEKRERPAAAAPPP
jgi:hypothetical protein